MSISDIPDKTRYLLWGKAAGRCEYEGCNKPLWLDSLTKAEFNTAYIAHIIADQPNGPRGDSELSEKLQRDISNLMLMCDEHHRLIDKEDIKGHSVERLREMKCKHEARIELLTSIQPEKNSEILLYGARIGEHHTHLSFEKAAIAMIPERYPASNKAIELSLKNSSFQDSESQYWSIEQEHLRRQFNERVKSRLASGEINHFSVFAFAPQPLLIELGRLLSDISVADVYQLHREPADWRWQEHPEGFDYRIVEPDTCADVVALNLSLSATINNNRISHTLTEPHSIWVLTIDNLNNDFLRSRLQLQMFRTKFRKLLDRIKAKHGESAVIHLFPAVPVSVAVEIGRVWMPKADLPIKIYEQNKKLDGFTPVLDLIQC